MHFVDHLANPVFYNPVLLFTNLALHATSLHVHVACMYLYSFSWGRLEFETLATKYLPHSEAALGIVFLSLLLIQSND